VPRDFQLYINDIQHSCKKIIKYTLNISQEQFFKDDLIYDAVLRNLLIIGEAAKNIPENVRSLYPKIEWKKICGFRDIVVHTYFGIDNAIVWDIIQTKIPVLLRELKK